MPYSDIPNIRVYDTPDFAGVLQQPFEDNEHICFASGGSLLSIFCIEQAHKIAQQQAAIMRNRLISISSLPCTYGCII